MIQEVNLFTVNNLDDVYGFVEQFISNDYRIVSVAYDNSSSPKTALIVYEYEKEDEA